MRINLWNRKWRVFEKRVRIFRHVPFVEFVLLAGSMATGKVREESDFDVILGVREKRVWTTWLLATAVLQLRGWREHPGVNPSDRISLSHFASPKGYRFSEPHNAYWQDLYQKMIPVMGSEEKMSLFFKVNDWLEPTRVYARSELYMEVQRSLLARFMEFILGGHLGDMLEKVFKGRVKNPGKLGYKPKLVYDNDRLEIYRDTRRIEEMIGWGKL